MDTENAKRLLEILAENSMRILRAGFGINHVESTFFDVVELLRANPALKAEFMSRVETSMMVLDSGRLDSEMLPKELIELVAHEMRWDEILDCAERRVQRRFSGDRSLAIGDIAVSVLDAFDDDWRDREFYRHYSG